MIGTPLSADQLLSRADSIFKFHHAGDGIDEVIVLDRQAVDLCPSGHPTRWYSLTMLAHHLWHRYNQQGSAEDLEEAIVVSREVLDLIPEGHWISRSLPLSTLSRYLFDQYQRLGTITDLDESIAFGRQELALREDPYLFMSLSIFANHLSVRYSQLGEITDLDEAIMFGRQALDLCPLDTPDRPSYMSIVSEYLCYRYKRLRAMTDLHEAIIIARQTLDLCPPGSPFRPVPLSHLASYLFLRYRELGALTDLNEAIILDRQALELHPPGNPDRLVSLNSIARSLYYQYEEFGTMTGLNEAIDFSREALDLRQPENPRRSTSLNHLASCLSFRYLELGEITDLSEAIVLGQEALKLYPPGHPDRSHSLNQLARHLRIRFLTQSSESKDKEDMFSLYTELAHVTPVTSASDFLAAKGWVMAAEEFHHPTMLLAYETCLHFLAQHLATAPSQSRNLQSLKDISSSLAVDAFSACLRGQSSKKAVELLEQGRGIFWSRISRLCSPLDDVIASDPAGKILADEFNRLTSHIHDVIHSDGKDRQDRLRGLNDDLQAVITDVRELPGFTRFLLPYLFSDLQHAASRGPVIIVNSSEYSCDALVVFFDRDPVHIPLQITKSGVQALSSELQYLTPSCTEAADVKGLPRFLRALWKEVVSPIVDFLKTTLPLQSRIWWCPTAEFSLLPLHAAGPYRKGRRNLSHLYISSYTPTLTSLIRARRNDPRSTTQGKHFLAIGQAEENGESEPASQAVGIEVVDIVCERMQGRAATVTRLEGPESNISRVSSELRKHEWVHFACDGFQKKKEPFGSAFALRDGHFAIEHLIECELESPEFAYLSACHTTTDGDEERPDEVIRLASAMQFAGFQSVVGTMWNVDDGQTNLIVAAFYENFMTDVEAGELDHTRAAVALNKTMNTLANISLDQRINYVHIGA